MSVVQRQQTKIQLEAIAEKFGCRVVIPTDGELVLDIDEGMKLNLLVYAVLMDDNYTIGDHLTTKSKGGNSHIYIRLNTEFSVAERVAMQAALGSDPMKELLSALTLQTSKVPVVMFETSEGYQQVMSWRKAK